MKSNFLFMLAMASFLFIISSCQYKFTVEPNPVPPNPEDTVSFSIDVVPIWNDNSNCVSCHNGTQRPDLQPDVAYGEIQSMGLVNSATPEESGIYKHPHPDTDTHSWKKYTATEAATILLWIEQGAKNN